MIDGKKAFPTMNEAIKITKENPYIKSSNSYTYDITFPLDIPENKIVFGNLDRIDVRKKTMKYTKCILYAGNKMVINGTGVVTNSTDNEIKLQIVAGTSELKYNDKTEKIYIDRIDAYQNPKIEELVSYGMTPFNAENKTGQDTMDGQACYIDTGILERKNYLGDIKKWVFMPVYDSTNDAMSNQFCYARYSGSGGPVKVILNRTCIQPNLISVLKQLLQYMGYSADLSLLDVAPWNELIIANAHRTMKVMDALPHWTVTTFLNELSNLFNVTFIIDDITKNIVVKSNKSATDEETVKYECEDEFSTEHDDDGIEYIGSSNIQYKLDQGGNYDVSIVSKDNLKAFGIKEYNTHTEMVDAMSGMTTKDKLQTIFHCDDGYYYFRYSQDTDREAGNDKISMSKFGEFTPLIRDIDSDNAIELRIVPLAMGRNEYAQLTLQHSTSNPDHWELCDRYRFTDNIPAVENSHDETADYDSSFVSVQDAIEDSEDKNTDETETDSNMYVGWVSKKMRRYQGSDMLRDNLSPAKRIDMWDGGAYFPILYADWGIMKCPETDGKNTMSLNLIKGYYNIGSFHQKKDGKSAVNNYDQIVIKFISDDIPNPRSKFMFKNKIFLCAKIEMNVKDDGVEKEKTGYFYET
jgi:hypothetical protein